MVFQTKACVGCWHHSPAEPWQRLCVTEFLGKKNLEIQLQEYPRGWELPCVPSLPLQGWHISGSCPALGSSVTSPCLPGEFWQRSLSLSGQGEPRTRLAAFPPPGCISPTYPSRFPPLGWSRASTGGSGDGDALSYELWWPRGLVPPVARLKRGRV